MTAPGGSGASNPGPGESEPRRKWGMLPPKLLNTEALVSSSSGQTLCLIFRQGAASGRLVFHSVLSHEGERGYNKLRLFVNCPQCVIWWHWVNMNTRPGPHAGPAKHKAWSPVPSPHLFPVYIYLILFEQRICWGFRAQVTWAWYCPLFGQPGCPHWAVIGRMSEIVHGIIEVEMVLEPLKRWGRQQQLAETQTRSFGISGKCHRDCPDRSW